jgi:hypothetical protein
MQRALLGHTTARLLVGLTVWFCAVEVRAVPAPERTHNFPFHSPVAWATLLPMLIWFACLVRRSGDHSEYCGIFNVSPSFIAWKSASKMDPGRRRKCSHLDWGLGAYFFLSAAFLSLDLGKPCLLFIDSRKRKLSPVISKISQW